MPIGMRYGSRIIGQCLWSLTGRRHFSSELLRPLLLRGNGYGRLLRLRLSKFEQRSGQCQSDFHWILTTTTSKAKATTLTSTSTPLPKPKQHHNGNILSRKHFAHYIRNNIRNLSSEASLALALPGRRHSKLHCGDKVKSALSNGEPIVALESTVVTHGLPEPENLSLAQNLERDIATMGSSFSPPSSGNSRPLTNQQQQQHQHQQQQPLVTPATIGVINGQIVVGLSNDELEYLATRRRSNPIKASRRDLPIAMANKLSAGTTVAATMAIASSLRWSFATKRAYRLSSLPSSSTLFAAGASQRGSADKFSHRLAATCTVVDRDDDIEATTTTPRPSTSVSRANSIASSSGPAPALRSVGGWSTTTTSGARGLGGDSDGGIIAATSDAATSTSTAAVFVEQAAAVAAADAEADEARGQQALSARASTKFNPITYYDPHQSPIKVFATGGLGGVHFGGEQSMDISADLYEFTRSPIGLVSAGFKSFLDIGRSLEFLETMGATVMSLSPSPGREIDLSPSAGRFHSQTQDYSGHLSSRGPFPGFFARDSGCQSPCEVGSIEEAARILYTCLDGSPLNDRRAALLAVPVPSEFDLSKSRYDYDDAFLDEDKQQQLPFDKLLEVIRAQVDAIAGIAGHEKTPLILDRLNRATKGKSLETNVALLRNNATIGARLAYEYALLANRTGAILGQSIGLEVDSARSNSSSSSRNNNNEGTIVNKIPIQSAPLKHYIEANKFIEPAPTDEDDMENGGEIDITGPIVVGCTMIDMHVSIEVNDRFKVSSLQVE